MALLLKWDTIKDTSWKIFNILKFINYLWKACHFDGVTGTTFSRGGTVPINLLVLSPLDVVTVVLLLVFNNLSFLTVILLPLPEGAGDMDAAKRLLVGVLLLVLTLFGRLELDDVSEKWSDLAPPLLPEPPLWCKEVEFGNRDLLEEAVDLRIPALEDTCCQLKYACKTSYYFDLLKITP